MSQSLPRSRSNSNTPGRSRWWAWSAAVPAVLAGTLATWMSDWTVGVGVASSVLNVTHQVIRSRTRK
ncbi:hypothetical protein [Rhodococcus artemisiae]|uniref:Holin n=1 Tax=Rhodococcus artemisiae TaxID=714159 RepID=A0ABU7LKR2_9NOCA|nr:hypothetical protein [Rhodococcus artemisiae]MEE2061799.1 hypothetical protein [Rhodococcus artemisiae]